MTTLEIYKNTRKMLDKTSSSMCLAKWKQTSLYLHVGKNSSCHLPVPHLITLDELSADPSALHNTSVKKQNQQEMLDGKRPAECANCWEIEDSDPNIFSDRITKSSEFWALPFNNEIIINRTNNSNPSYLEVSFSNVCNLKCSYCGPTTSSKYMEEIKQFGPYPTSGRYNAIKSYNKVFLEREHNPYVEAFWKWWPDLYKDLKVFRITGGEPLLSKHTFNAMDLIAENPKDDFSFEINTNLSVPDEQIDKLIDKMKKIKAKSKIIYTSCEGYGARAEYSRFGLNYNKWKENCKRILTELPDCKLSIMSAYNVFSVTNYNDFINDMFALRKQFKKLYFDVAFVRDPFHLSIFILDDSFESYIVKQIETFEKNNLSAFEINKIKRLLSVYKNRKKDGKDLIVGRQDFVKFVDEYDVRRKTDFLSTFPEMENFYYDCFSIR